MTYEEELYDQIHRSDVWKQYQKGEAKRSKMNVFYLVSLFSFLILVVFIVGIFIFIFFFLQGTLSAF